MQELTVLSSSQSHGSSCPAKRDLHRIWEWSIKVRWVWWGLDEVTYGASLPFNSGEKISRWFKGNRKLSLSIQLHKSTNIQIHNPQSTNPQTHHSFLRHLPQAPLYQSSRSKSSSFYLHNLKLELKLKNLSTHHWNDVASSLWDLVPVVKCSAAYNNCFETSTKEKVHFAPRAQPTSIFLHHSLKL